MRRDVRCNVCRLKAGKRVATMSWVARAWVVLFRDRNAVMSHSEGLARRRRDYPGQVRSAASEPHTGLRRRVSAKPAAEPRWGTPAW